TMLDEHLFLVGLRSRDAAGIESDDGEGIDAAAGVSVKLLAEQMVRRTGGPRTLAIDPSRCGTGRGRDTTRAPPLPPNASPDPSDAALPPSCRRFPLHRCRCASPPPGIPDTPCDARCCRSTSAPPPTAPATPPTSARAIATAAALPASPLRPRP